MKEEGVAVGHSDYHSLQQVYFLMHARNTVKMYPFSCSVLLSIRVYHQNHVSCPFLPCSKFCILS